MTDPRTAERAPAPGVGPAALLATLFAALLVALLPAVLPAQQDTSAAAGEEGRYATPADSAATAARLRGLTVDSLVPAPREPFVYPLGTRRNPFRPPASAGGSGPTFASLTLAGIIYAPETGSVVIIAHPPTGRRYRLRVGDRLGDARLVEIGPRRAVFEVASYGTTRRTVLTLRESQERGRE